MSYENRAENIAAKSLTAQRFKSACETPIAKCELYCSGRTPTSGSDLCSDDRTPTAKFELYYVGRNLISGSDLIDKLMGDFYRAEGTMVIKECHVLHITIYIKVQQ